MRHGEETRIESHDEVESGGGRALDETEKKTMMMEINGKCRCYCAC
jgi:hypothetical protein